MKLRLIIAGGRDFDFDELLEKECDAFLTQLVRNVPRSDIEVVTGGQYGADARGDKYAKKRGFSRKQFKAEWERYGLPAGPIRNAKMVEYAGNSAFLAEGNKAALIAFWNGKSSGTADVVNKAQKRHIQTKVVLYGK